MPELKFEIDDKMYTISCEEGEEDELKKALKKVNEKMEIYKTENDISLTKKILMVSILLANDLNKIEQISTDKKIEKFNSILEKIEILLEV